MQIPEERKNIFKRAIPILILICLAVAYCNVSNIHRVFHIFASIILSMIVAELILRMAILIEEWTNIESRYDHDYSKLWQSVFTTPWQIILAAVVSYFILCITWEHQNYDTYFICSITMAAYFMQPFLQLKSTPIYKSLHIASPNTIDIGAGMAVGFYHGYLNILLPAGPTNDRGIKYLMDMYEAREKIKFIRKALYILVPLSLDCAYNLTQKSHLILEANSLQSIKEDRAGVKNRSYKNSVYKIKHNNGYFYVAAEYASPLKTFRESVESDGIFAKHYKLHKKDILWEFYTTIIKLVNNNPDTRGLCEFIYYADTDAAGDPVDIGKVLLDRLSADVTKDTDKKKII